VTRAAATRAVAGAAVTAAVIAASAGAAAADPTRRLSLGAVTGAHVFSHELELGVADAPDMPTPASGALLGARVGYAFTDRVTGEGEIVVVPTGPRDTDASAVVLGWRLQAAVYPLAPSRVRPFVVAGAGLMQLLPGGDAPMDGDVDLAFHWGAGAEYRLRPRIDLRLEARHVIAPSTGDSGAASDLEIAGGVAFRLGGAAPAPVPAEARDGDGDGVADAADECPADAEDRDRHQDDDGCPDADNDVDGIADADDGCPGAAEDRDRHQDEDGCPDPDNDGDGVADASDACPIEPETANGHLDQDGCPDVLDLELDGITFAAGSSAIAADQARVLDKAVKKLKKYAAVRVEIAGHAHREGSRTASIDLSLQRAEAVKAFLVGRGIAADRLDTTGYGPDLPLPEPGAGGARNRRVELRVVQPEPDADAP
jgi:outer membrane protein OmpA-like peptidoglycan-associated protein